MILHLGNLPAEKSFMGISTGDGALLSDLKDGIAGPTRVGSTEGLTEFTGELSAEDQAVVDRLGEQVVVYEDNE